MSHSQFHSIDLFILRHAWLNLWDKRMLLAESTRLLSLHIFDVYIQLHPSSTLVKYRYSSYTDFGTFILSNTTYRITSFWYYFRNRRVKACRDLILNPYHTMYSFLPALHFFPCCVEGISYISEQSTLRLFLASSSDKYRCCSTTCATIHTFRGPMLLPGCTPTNNIHR